MMSYDSYNSNRSRFTTYASLHDRNKLFGYDYLQKHPRLQNYNERYFEYREKSYEVDPDIKVQNKARLDNPNVFPNLYDDNIKTDRANTSLPNRKRTWEPHSSSAVPSVSGQYSTFTPTTREHRGPTTRDTYWVADLNAEIFDRRLSLSAKEQPYVNHYRRQGMISLIAKDMNPSNDVYTKRVLPMPHGEGHLDAKNGNNTTEADTNTDKTQTLS